jgi:hypothetical protein
MPPKNHEAGPRCGRSALSEAEAQPGRRGDVVALEKAEGQSAIRLREHDPEIKIPLWCKPPIDSGRDRVERPGAFRTDEGPVEPDAVRREDGSWLISGSMPADEMADRLSVALPPDRSYHTAAGFMLSQLGHLPEVGESFDSHGWRFEVIDLDGRRLDKILASCIPAGGPAEQLDELASF